MTYIEYCIIVSTMIRGHESHESVTGTKYF
jgi:hypothetical protein